MYGKGDVVNNALENASSLGVIDEDPHRRQPHNLQQFSVEEQLSTLKLRKHPENNSTLVVISPELEDWLKKAADEAGVDVTECGLPEKMKHFRDTLQSSTRDQSNLKKLLKALDKKNSRFLSDLRQALKQS